MKKKRIHYFQHVSFENLGCIEQWINQNGHQLSYTRFYNDEPIPELADIDWLIVMGGPMGVYENDIYPWIEYEKAFIKKAIDAKKTVIGICLGSQLIASALGAKVYPNDFKEIGWFDISLTQQGADSILFKDFNKKTKVFHWHGDTYDLPKDAQHIFQSLACKNQCFVYKSKVIGLQFHIEISEESLKEMIYNGKHELIENEYVQKEEDLLKDKNLILENNKLMFGVLDKLANEQ
jgi:GMP synthase-like glutamine amidotransferase